jgi:acyl dehydratase
MTATRNLTDPRRLADGQDPEAGLKAPVYEAITIPERFGPVRLLVDDWKIKRFAFAQDDFGDWFLRSSPFGGHRIGHAALLANDLLQLFTTRYAASQVVGLHTEEELWFSRPVFFGEEVVLDGGYVDQFERRGQGHVVMEATARDPGGHVLLRHRGVEIMRTVPGTVAGRGSAAASSGRRVTGEYDPRLPMAEQLQPFPEAPPGTGLVPLTKEATQEQMSVFSRCGEYVRNIHNDLQIARRGGLNVPIVQGQQQVCWLAELLTRVFGTAWFSTGWMHCKFLKPVSAMSAAEMGGVVTRSGPDAADRNSADVDIWVKVNGVLATVGYARCALTGTPSQG